MFVLPKVRGCVVMLGLIGGGVGIWLVLDGLSTGEDEIFIFIDFRSSLIPEGG